MEPPVRRLLTFPCAGADLAATLDGAGGPTGVLLVTGGSQTRIGSHRMYERLARSLSERGFYCFRYDRRGVGDSAGEDPGFKGSGPDLEAAAAALRAQTGGVGRLFGMGLCDGATALALFGKAAGLDGLILVNPWLVEASAGEPPPAAIKQHYARQLSSRDGWRKILSGAVDWRKLFKGVRSISGKQESAPLARETALALRASALRTWLILAEGDATAIAAAHELRSPTFDGLIEGREAIKTDSHTFARQGDEAALLAATLRALKALGG
jgi:exosortase A-associated hydrolase 1